MGWQSCGKNSQYLGKRVTYMKREYFLGYPVDNVTMYEALSWIKNSKEQTRTRIIAVTNANKLWQAYHDIRLSEYLKNADLVLPEYAVVWGARRMNISLNHLGGIMLFSAFLPFAEKEKIRPFFLGARPEVVGKMVDRIKRLYPNILISGFHHGYLDSDQVKESVIKELREKRPDILFVAMGSPKQEFLMTELKNSLSIPILMGVGGSFDVISGEKNDAPSWVRSKGIEWIYRIAQEPFKFAYWKRYLITNIWFIYQIYKHSILSLSPKI